jgi:hypothetical protein
MFVNFLQSNVGCKLSQLEHKTFLGSSLRCVSQERGLLAQIEICLSPVRKLTPNAAAWNSGNPRSNGTCFSQKRSSYVRTWLSSPRDVRTTSTRCLDSSSATRVDLLELLVPLDSPIKC